MCFNSLKRCKAGLDTIGVDDERERLLSDGRRQRVAIAELCKDRLVFTILDEAVCIRYREWKTFYSPQEALDRLSWGEQIPAFVVLPYPSIEHCSKCSSIIIT